MYPAYGRDFSCPFQTRFYSASSFFGVNLMQELQDFSGVAKFFHFPVRSFSSYVNAVFYNTVPDAGCAKDA